MKPCGGQAGHLISLHTPSHRTPLAISSHPTRHRTPLAISSHSSSHLAPLAISSHSPSPRDCVELFECECGDVEQEFDLQDPDLNELEECGGGYLSEDSDDGVLVLLWSLWCARTVVVVV